jgi:hypothetical protein
MDPLESISDESFWSMARRVRQEASEELAEIEYETDRAEVKRQDFTARSMRAMMEGERWQVIVGSRTIDGVVVHPGENYVGLQDRVGNLHDVVHAALAMVRVIEVDPELGRAPMTFRPATFRARLLSLEQVREVELAGRDGSWSLLGTIDSVNIDHIQFMQRDAETTLVPIDAIGYLGRAAAPHDRTRGRG